MVIGIITAFFLLAGLFFFLSGTVGFLRFPDLYSRMHATGKGDTLGLLLCLVGLAIYNIVVDFTWLGLVQSVKIVSIGVFWFVASPTATHALLRSAFETGVRPWTKDGRSLVEKGGNKSE